VDLVQKALNNDRLAIAKLLTLAESQDAGFLHASSILFQHSGKGFRIGITGAPGTGKSTLTAKLALAFRALDKTVAIIAVDPSSPFSGGALLGDRIRMRELSGDKGIFIRSMASRGALGGIARTTADAAMVFDAAGFDIILIETVGAGQSEVEIAALVHTVLVVESPGLGDEIQAIKAGILEIADILVINKADLPGVLRTENALMSAFHTSKKHAFRHHSDVETTGSHAPVKEDEGWQVPILRTIALSNEGLIPVREAILSHQTYLLENGYWSEKEKQRLRFEFEEHLRELFFQHWQQMHSEAEQADLMRQLYERKISPQHLALKQVESE